MRYFFIDPDEVGKEAPVVGGAEARHILDVLRLGAGDRIGLLDGRGNAYEAEITGRRGHAVAVVIRGTLRVAGESPVAIVVAQALLKEKKMDRLLRHLTELGIAEWRPVVSERAIPRVQGGKAAAKTLRWEKIAMEAVKQCRRGRAPRIFAPVSLGELLRSDPVCGLKIAFWESEERLLPRRLATAAEGEREPRRALLLLGPEGGFSTDEMAAAAAHGFVTVSLGPRVLRAETAAVAAVTLVQFLFGDMGGKVGPAAGRAARRIGGLEWWSGGILE